MKLLGRNLLQPLRGLDMETDRWLNSWMSEITHATWKAHPEVAKQYPKAISEKKGFFCFRVAAQNVMVEVQFCFSQGIAMISGLRNE